MCAHSHHSETSSFTGRGICRANTRPGRGKWSAPAAVLRRGDSSQTAMASCAQFGRGARRRCCQTSDRCSHTLCTSTIRERLTAAHQPAAMEMSSCPQFQTGFQRHYHHIIMVAVPRYSDAGANNNSSNNTDFCVIAAGSCRLKFLPCSIPVSMSPPKELIGAEMTGTIYSAGVF